MGLRGTQLRALVMYMCIVDLFLSLSFSSVLSPFSVALGTAADSELN